MVVIGEIAAAPAFTVRQEANAVTAAEVMRDASVGDVIVVGDDGRLTGIVTDRDLAVRVIAAGRDPETVVIADVCTPDPITIGIMATPKEAEDLMRAHLIHRLPVVDDDRRPMGLLALEDLAATTYVDDDEVVAVFRSIARAYQLRSAPQGALAQNHPCRLAHASSAPDMTSMTTSTATRWGTSVDPFTMMFMPYTDASAVTGKVTTATTARRSAAIVIFVSVRAR
jgi:signal-transduction protein with cAMP-binding, CBS, and nucleotidyltransferase domain